MLDVRSLKVLIQYNLHVHHSAFTILRRDKIRVTGFTGILGATPAKKIALFCPYNYEVALCGHMCVIYILICYMIALITFFFENRVPEYSPVVSLIKIHSLKSDTYDLFIIGGFSDNAIPDGIQRYTMIF